MQQLTLELSQHPDDTEYHGAFLLVKAVPGASRDQIAGPLGDRLKVRISAPPEGGKANASICKLLAKHLGVKPAQVSIVGGMSNPEKRVQILGVEQSAVDALLSDKQR